jgi:hypothetical protein
VPRCLDAGNILTGEMMLRQGKCGKGVTEDRRA